MGTSGGRSMTMDQVSGRGFFFAGYSLGVGCSSGLCPAWWRLLLTLAVAMRDVIDTGAGLQRAKLLARVNGLGHVAGIRQLPGQNLEVAGLSPLWSRVMFHLGTVRGWCAEQELAVGSLLHSLLGCLYSWHLCWAGLSGTVPISRRHHHLPSIELYAVST